jgi:hypothetical protein
MLSNGYLQPARQFWDVEKQGESTALSMQEQQVLAQERALKSASAGAKVSTTYRYSIGPDGRRYITGAEVIIEGDEQTVDRVGGGFKRESIADKTGKTEGRSKPADEKAVQSASFDDSEDDSKKEAVRELQQIEREVVAHEAAHQAAGGRFAGAVSYSYTRGPDGKSYITGGEVPIHVPPSDDPEQTLRDMEQVQRAALAPGNPSGQDLSVAAQAAAAAAQARQALSRAENESATSRETGKTGSEDREPQAVVAEGTPRFKESDSKVGADGKETEKEKTLFSQDRLNLLKDAYARYVSPYGLWAWGRGFEPVSKETALPRFDFAA